MTLSKQKKRTFTIIMFLFTIVLMFIVGEIATRIYYASEKEVVPAPPYDYRQLDDKYGWFTKSNYYHKGSMKDKAGVEYDIEIKTNEHGFKTFDDVNSNKPKVFFIGDSYTHAVEVSNDKSFYNILKDSLDFSCFAYGSAGYGTLQEYMITSEYIDEINPDVLILQVCSNDFIDNDAELEIASTYKVGKPRPYMNTNGTIETKIPQPAFERMKKYSTFIYFLRTKIGGLNNDPKPVEETGEKLITDLGQDYPPYRASVQATELVFKKFKQLADDNGAKLMVFNADHYNPQSKDFQKICANNNIHYINNVAEHLVQLEYQGKVLRAADGYHWNEAGHKQIASAIQPDLKNALESLN